MKFTTEDFQIKTYDSDLGNKNNIPKFKQEKLVPSSRREININKNNQNTEIFDFTSTSKNTSFTQDQNNASSLSFETGDNYLYGNDYSIFVKPYKIGKTRVCLYIKKYPIFSIGKNILYPLLLICFICLLYIILWILFYKDSGSLLKKLFNYFFVIYFISHLLSIFINPGIPSFKYHQSVKYDLKEKNINRFSCSKCKRCNLYYRLKENIGHCSQCNICYFGYDRHCFWIGHCIGKYNKFFFMCFVLSLLTFILLCLTMIGVKILKIVLIKQK